MPELLDDLSINWALARLIEHPQRRYGQARGGDGWQEHMQR